LYIELPHVLLLHLALLHQNKGKNDIEFTTPKKKKKKEIEKTIKKKKKKYPKKKLIKQKQKKK